MKLTRANLFLGVLMLGVVVLAVLMGRDMSRPNGEFLPDMKYSPAYGAYSANPNFEDGRTMQSPVAGTIARGDLPLHFTASKEDALRAGKELSNPFQAHQKTLRRSIARGRNVFHITCAACHGAGGLGDAPVTKRGFPPPPSLLTGKSLKMKDGQLFHILTYGQGSMAPVAGQLTRRQRWDAVNFVRDLQDRFAKQERSKKAVSSARKPERKNRKKP